MSPKKLLRLPEAKSSLDDMSEGTGYIRVCVCISIPFSFSLSLSLSQVPHSRDSFLMLQTLDPTQLRDTFSVPGRYIMS